MGLVEVDPRQPRLKLRVFRRADNLLILLWNNIPHSQGHPVITAKCIEDGKKLDIQNFIVGDEVKKLANDLPHKFDGIICLIQETKNGLEYSKNYYVTVSFPSISESIKVYRTGVLPDHEAELPDHNIHTFLWDATAQRWRKQEGMEVVVEEGGKTVKRFAALTTVIPCPKCGYSGDK